MIRDHAFEGHRCVEVSHPGGDRLLVTIDMGPRVLGYLDGQGTNRFAVLPEAGLHSGDGRFRFVGGHRLWISPEVPERTYLPDESPCDVDRAGDSLVVTAPDNGPGLERSVAVTPSESGFTVDHVVSNVGERATEAIAPWAITQFPVGGVGIGALAPPPNGRGPQASHALVLWPYTDLEDERLTVAGGHVLVASTAEPSPCKVGFAPGSGRLGYWRAGDLFLKEAPVPEGPVPDRGAASQIYTGAGFLELETLGSSVVLQPGDRVSHTERWTARAVSGLEEAIDIVVGRT